MKIFELLMNIVGGLVTLILLLVFGVIRKYAATVESQLPKHTNKRKMILNRDIYPDSITIDGKKHKFVIIETYVSKMITSGRIKKYSLHTQTPK